MCASDFNTISSHEEYLRKYVDYFKKLNLPKNIDGFTLEILLQEAYHDIYKIVDLDSKNMKRPLVAYTNADTLGDIGSIGELIGEFRDNDISNIFGLSFLEYCDLPYSTSRLLINRVKTERQTEKEIKQEVERQLADEQRKNRRK